jgi:hypothetical protein
MLVMAGLAIMLLLQAAGVAAQEPEDASEEGDLSITDRVWLDPAACPPEQTVGATVRQIKRASARFHGRCVRVKGYRGEGGLFSGRKAHKERLGARGGENRIGLYGDYSLDEVQGDVEVVGKVGWCADLHREPGVVMVFGYCHYHRGAFISAARIVRR